MIVPGPVTRNLFFTGKGGVGKTSVASATAVGLAEGGKRVLLVSTDPASNLGEVFGVELGTAPAPVPGVANLFAMNIDPEAAAHAYRERMVGPYRGVLPDASVRSMEEQFSGACTTEIAAFDEFSKLLGDASATAEYDHVLFDTAPTGHTLRLLRLPAAWTVFFDANVGGNSCLGPLSGLAAQRALYEAALKVLADGDATTLVLVSRPEKAALLEADRSSRELAELGVKNQRLVLNGVFRASDSSDATAAAMEARGRAALMELPEGLARLPRHEVRLLPYGLVGVSALRALNAPDSFGGPAPTPPGEQGSQGLPPPLDSLIPELTRGGRGVILTMGKGGVGKTTVATRLAVTLARLGHTVHLSTTDPAAHLDQTLGSRVPNLSVSRIDPAKETADYTAEVMATAGKDLDEQGKALLEEDLRSPCTEEIAVFRAFARTVDRGKAGFVVLDTAPTGHTLLLLDATEAYHRDVLRNLSAMPESVRELLPRLRDAEFTKVLIVTLPEATPVHEAASLQRDLLRAGITPFAWVVNQSLSPLPITDVVLRSRKLHERAFLREVTESLSPRTALVPWQSDGAGLPSEPESERVRKQEALR
ncbi:arsenical pump-driving ATPase [Planctomyces sp. SH-PL62]|uniref:arsenical pump-driving ATPase n=1 Tax=Planctomyces sp. SH-PL62 TaxID=1636152 RepID=UPI00078DDC6D|nr:arsenical pump-driving ATPase [Planctomyces sp. SH-PL62]AMV36361.1 Arsenical pump-driving ATPase [Planctomyces sp. SH-PL62]